jgi:hypothetical protein
MYGHPKRHPIQNVDELGESLWLETPPDPRFQIPEILARNPCLKSLPKILCLKSFA